VTDSFKAKTTLTVGNKAYTIFSLAEAEKNGLDGISRLPHSLKVVLENLLRFEDGRTVKAQDIEAIKAWLEDRGKAGHEISYRPARVLISPASPPSSISPPCATPPPSSAPIRKRSIPSCPSIWSSTTR
jgi:aconitase A